MSAGLPLPKQIVVHGFLFNRGEKMSKSVGNVVSPADLVVNYGLDPVRYFFLRETPWGQDGNYSHELIVNRMNADLANDLGNLAQRSLSIVARNGAAVPEAGAFTAGRRGDAGRRLCGAGSGARAYARVPASSLYRRGDGDGRRGQSLFRQCRAVEARQDRSGAHAGGALCDAGDAAGRRDPVAAGDARLDGQAARSAGGSRGANAASPTSARRAASRRGRRCRRRRPYSRATRRSEPSSGGRSHFGDDRGELRSAGGLRADAHARDSAA